MAKIFMIFDLQRLSAQNESAVYQHKMAHIEMRHRTIFLLPHFSTFNSCYDSTFNSCYDSTTTTRPISNFRLRSWSPEPRWTQVPDSESPSPPQTIVRWTRWVSEFHNTKIEFNFLKQKCENFSFSATSSFKTSNHCKLDWIWKFGFIFIDHQRQQHAARLGRTVLLEYSRTMSYVLHMWLYTIAYCMCNVRYANAICAAAQWLDNEICNTTSNTQWGRGGSSIIS